MKVWQTMHDYGVEQNTCLLHLKIHCLFRDSSTTVMCTWSLLHRAAATIAPHATDSLRRCLDHGRQVPLLVFCEVGDELVPVRQGPPNDLVGGVLLGPPAQGRVLAVRHQAHLHDFLQHAEPVSQRACGEVDEAERVAPEEPLPLELRVQDPQALLGLPRQPRLLLAVRPHRLPQRLQALVGDEVGPEAGRGAVVRVRGEEPGRRFVMEGLVDVLDDEEGLADGAVAVEEDGDRLVDGVVGEQQLALVGQVLHEQLVRHPLERQRHLHPVRKRAAERRDDPHRRLRRSLCWLQRHPG
ncbi:hypothetical protein VPH35_134868 [Triticum aestivum]|uniref:Uncharacterized protein n=1 Tax=Aegilops tauschii subsp. strangulata TaxID=200361 RepID=A0A453QKS7_AEGTS